MKIIRVNVSAREITSEEPKDSWKYFGNRGLVAKILTDEVDPASDPLGKDNKFIFATGLFAGTPIPTSDRLSVGCKSPLTGGIKEANSGGNLAASLSAHGIKAIIIEDLPTDSGWQILHVNAAGEVALVPAGEYAGLGNYAFVERLHEKYGKDIAVASLGIAGERMYKASTIQVTDHATGHPCRAAARGGVGAVLGTKKIKGLVVEKPSSKYRTQPVDKDLFNEGKKGLMDMLKSHPYTGAGLGLFGTPAFVDITAEDGMLPVKNFNGSRLPADKISGVEIRTFINNINQNKGKVGVACQAGCTIRCSNIYNNKDGEMVTSGFEYETLALIGPNCDIYDMDFIAEADRFCDDVGLDTIEIGVALGIAMDEGKIPWGDIGAVKNIFQEIAAGEGFGKIVADGAQAVGDALLARRVPTVRSQALAAYDPRGSQGMGITFAASPQGADHTTCNTLGISDYDHQAVKGIAGILKETRTKVALGDNCMCFFAMVAIAEDKDGYQAMAKTMSGLFGEEFSPDRIKQIGVDTLKMEYEYNEKAGFKPEDNKLPQFFYDEVSTSTGRAFGVSYDETIASI